MELTEVEKKSLVLWSAVGNALLGLIQHHQDQVPAAIVRPFPRGVDIHYKMMRRAAKTLAVFTDPSDD